jgi:hypothetical protein
LQDVDNLVFIDVMVVNVRRSSYRIYIESRSQAFSSF